MDSSDEKATPDDTRSDLSNPTSRPISSDDPEKHFATDPGKDIAPLRTPRVPLTGTDRDKHWSIESAADKHKRESVESARPRQSIVSALTEPTLYEAAIIDSSEGTEEVQNERHAAFDAAAQARLNVSRPENFRGLTGASATTIGGASRRSLPSLRRKETKLAQKEAHPW